MVSMTRRERTAAVALTAWALAWFVIMAWNGGGSWHFFVQGAQALADTDDAIRGGLHTYAAAPVLQIGPVALLAAMAAMPAGAAGGLAIWQVLGAAAGLVVLWQVRQVGAAARPDLLHDGRLDRRVAAAAVCFVPVWLFLAVGVTHVDDVLALLFAVLALRATAVGRPVLTGALLGLAVDAKPWALPFGCLLLLLDGRRKALSAATTMTAVIAAAWLPFFLADPATSNALHFTIPNTELSALRVLGVHDARTPPWDRPAQAVLGTVLALLAWRRGRWAAMVLLAVGARVVLDPGTNKYYVAGVVVGAALWDVLGSRAEWPWWTATACLGLFTARWVPMPDAAHGRLALAYVSACAFLLITPAGAGTFSDRSGPTCEAAEMTIARRMANKVPEVTVYFWIIKVLATTVGETAADLLNMNLGLGLTWTTVVMGVLTAGALVLQFRSQRYVPWRYWLVVILISVVGTLITDNLVDNFGVPLEVTIAVFAAALAATFVLWHRSEHTLSIHTITTPRRESYYWAAILFTFALGTAAGDLLAERINVGYLPSAGIFAAAIALIALGFRLRVLGAVLAFWAAYVLTRPLGASLGDWLSQSRDDGGLGLGTVGPSVVFLLASVALVGYLTRSRVDAPAERPTTPAPVNARAYP
ncbi:hypothetical protein AB0K00_09505 [Dactylosporangium sp. NPDC049525]|uniref:hypothetical protein n=1 Tax=Dactylosporangium sp. NPDC049525 TaxID=3154730 RepID=UPI00342BE7B4